MKALPTIHRSLLVLSAALALGLTACDEENDHPSDIDSLRVLAVRAATPFAQPGTDVEMQMLSWDGSPSAVRPDGTRRPISRLWIGGCTNPPGDLFKICIPYLHEVVRQLGDEALATQQLPPGAPAGIVGWGETFQAQIPADAVSSRSVASGVVHPYGVQYVFFAACAGELRRIAVDPDQFPLGCYDSSGKALGRDDYEFGYYPLYIYNDVPNANPDLQGAAFNGLAPTQACDAQNPCPTGQHCGSQSICIPSVPHCAAQDADDCPNYIFDIAVTPASAEKAVLARVAAENANTESVWVTYYANTGSFEKDARTINDPMSGWTGDFFGSWRARTAPGTEARLWAVVRDNRNGVSWRWQDVWVE